MLSAPRLCCAGQCKEGTDEVCRPKAGLDCLSYLHVFYIFQSRVPLFTRNKYFVPLE